MFDHVPGCSCCGEPLDGVDLDIRSSLPDAILALPAEQRASAWGNSDFQRIEGVGGFLRCLMPVHLTGVASVTYSVWLKLDDEQLRHANAVWTTPEYADLTLRGEVANAIEPWPGLLGEVAGAEVRDAGTLPYLVAERDSLLSRVLTEAWDRDDVLSRIWHPLPLSVRQQITASWSVERTAGLGSRTADGIMMFAGRGRTVHIEAFDTSKAMTADAAIAEFSGDLPERCDGELSEQDGEVVRRAFWLTVVVDGKPQHELYGYAATSEGILCVTCMHDDASDQAWAQQVWRSARYDNTEQDAGQSPV
ncbi:DUF2199 domain-containing protein [Micromonospora sp. C51]|uniref:DUF2199 domain-containing protein n=1 Tax=Micromonospora sp. C51 TaxID=2824879 RepID=UPI0027DDB141|nr:DUF2199 domain-containing protein [Micromonospora sp. C51]